MGPLSRLIARSVEQISSNDGAAALIYGVLEDLVSFARTLATQWRQNKLSEIDASEEAIFIGVEARTTTLPRLWHLLKMVLFACVNVLKVTIARTVADAALGGDACMSLAFVSLLPASIDCIDGLMSTRSIASPFLDPAVHSLPILRAGSQKKLTSPSPQTPPSSRRRRSTYFVICRSSRNVSGATTRSRRWYS